MERKRSWSAKSGRPENNMCLNGDKFEHHRIGNNLKMEKHSYTDPKGEVINEKEYNKDLGVYLPLLRFLRSYLLGVIRGLPSCLAS